MEVKQNTWRLQLQHATDFYNVSQLIKKQTTDSKSSEFLLPISAVMKERCRWQGGREGRQAAGRFSITHTTWTLQEEAPAAPDSVGSVWSRRVVNIRRA